MSKEVGAGGRLDIFLDSGFYEDKSSSDKRFKNIDVLEGG